MTSKDLVINFITQYRKPFSAPTLSGMTELDLSVVEPILIELRAENLIKRISQHEPIYVYADRNEVNVYNIQRTDWVYNHKDCQSLVKLLSTERFTSARNISAAFGKSRQWVFLYLEALASIDAIGLDQSGYYVKPQADLSTFGTIVIPGILNELRVTCREQKRQQDLAAKTAREQESKRLRLEYIEHLEAKYGIRLPK